MKLKQRFRKVIKWFNPSYCIAVVCAGGVVFCLFNAYGINHQCNRYLAGQHALITRQMKGERDNIHSEHADNIIYRYASVTDQMNTAKDKAKVLKAKQKAKQREHVHKHKPSRAVIARKQHRAAELKAKLQIMVGQHNLYLLKHPQLQKQARYRKFRSLTKDTAAVRIKHNKQSIRGFKRDLKAQKIQVRWDVPHQPSTNALNARAHVEPFQKLVSNTVSIILLALIGFIFMLKGFGYKHEQQKKAEAAHLTHLYGDDKPETPDDE